MTPGARRRGALVGAVFVALLGCLGPVEPAGAQERRVVVVSDSIAAGARSQLTSALEARGWRVTFDAEQNRTTYSAAAVVASHRAELTDTVVLSLGANDGGDPDTYRDRVESVLAELEGVPHVYWLSLHEVRDGYVAVNEVLRDVARSHPNLTVLDWHSLASADASLTASDGLHLSRAGGEAMAGLVAGAVTSPATPAPPSSTVPATTPTSAVPATSLPVTERPAVDAGAGASDRAEPRANRTGRSGWASLAGWTATGFLAVSAALVLAGTCLGVWSLWTTRRAPAWASEPPRSPNHPAVRAQQRASRIAEARRLAEASYLNSSMEES